MPAIPTVFNRQIRQAMPPVSAWVEAWGFLLAGIGLFLGLALYSYSPADYSATGLVRSLNNMAGPFGAIASRHILTHIGIIGMLLPVFCVIWGGFTATGFVTTPRAHRIVGGIILTLTLSSFCSVHLPTTSLPEPSFGFGGKIGDLVAQIIIPRIGYGGSLIALAISGLIGLVLTRNIRASRTAEVAEYGMYLTRRGVKKAWWRYILNRDTHSNQNSIAKSVAVPYQSSSGQNSSDAGRTSGAKRKRRSAASALSPASEADTTDESSTNAPSPEAALELEIDYRGGTHSKPSAALFSRSQKISTKGSNFQAQAEMLTKQLAEFKIMGKVRNVTKGPVVTTYEFEPAPGTKLSKIASMGEDLARMLRAQSLRVLAPIPGKDTVGFEVPNAERTMIGFSSLTDTKDFKSTKRRLPIAMGVDIFGKPIVEDLAEMPHLLVAGSTGSGKSVFMNTLVGSLLLRHSAKDLRLIMVDPKMVEMAAYNGLPHMACPVVTDPQGEALAVLQGLVKEMDERYQRMRALGARNITSFNEIIKGRRKSQFPKYEGRWSTMPYIVLIIDELADMMMLLGKEVETPITRLAQKARACGIHLVIATQRPSAEVVTGLIKANFPTRVAFRVLSGIDSRTILDNSGAETLLGKGDMLFLSSAGSTKRLHGAFLSEKEVGAMVKATGGARKKR